MDKTNGDEDGWQYAFNWEFKFSKSSGATSNVRKRRWVCFSQDKILNLKDTNKKIKNCIICKYSKIDYMENRILENRDGVSLVCDIHLSLCLCTKYLLCIVR